MIKKNIGIIKLVESLNSYSYSTMNESTVIIPINGYSDVLFDDSDAEIAKIAKKIGPEKDLRMIESRYDNSEYVEELFSTYRNKVKEFDTAKYGKVFLLNNRSCPVLKIPTKYRNEFIYIMNKQCMSDSAEVLLVNHYIKSVKDTRVPRIVSEIVEDTYKIYCKVDYSRQYAISRRVVLEYKDIIYYAEFDDINPFNGKQVIYISVEDSPSKAYTIVHDLSNPKSADDLCGTMAKFIIDKVKSL